MGLFVSENPVVIYLDYIDGGDSGIYVIKDEKAKEVYSKILKRARVKLRRANWELYNIYMEGCVIQNVEKGDAVMDPSKFTRNRFQTLILEIIDNVNKPESEWKKIPIDNFSITNMDPVFINSIIDEYDNLLALEKIDFLTKNGISNEDINNIKKEISEGEVQNS